MVSTIPPRQMAAAPTSTLIVTRSKERRKMVLRITVKSGVVEMSGETSTTSPISSAVMFMVTAAALSSPDRPNHTSVSRRKISSRYFRVASR